MLSLNSSPAGLIWNLVVHWYSHGEGLSRNGRVPVLFVVPVVCYTENGLSSNFKVRLRFQGTCFDCRFRSWRYPNVSMCKGFQGVTRLNGCSRAYSIVQRHSEQGLSLNYNSKLSRHQYTVHRVLLCDTRPVQHKYPIIIKSQNCTLEWDTLYTSASILQSGVQRSNVLGR